MIEDIEASPNLQLPEPLTIALDYDGTASTHPVFWHSFVCMAKAVGYRVLIVTMRTEEEADDIYGPLADEVDAVICTNRRAKHQFVTELGVRIDMWIDDCPAAILFDAHEAYGKVTGTLELKVV